MRFLGALLALLVLPLLAAGQAVEVQASFVDESAVVGEPTSFVVAVAVAMPLDAREEPKIVTPQLPAVAGLEIEYLGGGIESSGQRVSIVNGRRSGSIDYRARYEYRVVAAAEGRYRMPPFTVTVGDRNFDCQPQRAVLEVGKVAPGNRWVGLAVVADRLDPYVNQPVRLRWVLSSERLVVDTRESMPRLEVPWAGSPPGFLAEPDEPLDRNDPQFTNVRLGDQVRRLPRVIRDDRKPPILELTLAKTLIPLAPGRIDLGGTRASLEVAENARRSFFGIEYEGRKKAFVTSEPIVLEVRDAPLAGRPEGYRDAIGDFEVRVAYGSGKIRAGDGVTLNLTLSGSPVVDLIEAPDIGADFPNCRTLPSPKESSGEGANRSVTFSWLIRPLDDGQRELPDFRYAWFRPATETFSVASTGALPLEISGTFEESDVFSADGGGRLAFKPIGEGLRLPVGEPGDMRPLDRRIPAAWFLVVILVPMASLLISSVLLRRRRALSGDLELQRRRKASKQAQARLDEARALLGQKGFHGRLSRCLAGFVADKLGLPPASVSAANLRGLLERGRCSGELATTSAAFLDELDRAAFGGEAGDERSSLDRAEELLARLDREIRA
ncbi:MAG: BatD family protein [Planctomycetes bacterium]|nr:BatD family protein [Planctomycetota bacterium]